MNKQQAVETIKSAVSALRHANKLVIKAEEEAKKQAELNDLTYQTSGSPIYPQSELNKDLIEQLPYAIIELLMSSDCNCEDCR